MASIHHIEGKTKQQVTIATGLTSTNLSKCNDQRQSPLFNKLPAEIRNMIFCLATRSDDHPKVTWNKYRQEFQPDDSSSHKDLTSLLQTCRLIWLETSHLPLQQATHRFFFTSPEYYNPNYALFDVKAQRHRELCRTLTPNGRLNLHHIHYWLASNAETGSQSMTWPGKCLSRLRAKSQWSEVPCFVPEIVTVTVRYHGLKTLPGYLRGYLSQLTDVIRFATDGAALTFRLELETPAEDTAELRDVVKTLQSLRSFRENEYCLENNPKNPEISRLELQTPTEESSRIVRRGEVRPDRQGEARSGGRVKDEELTDTEFVVFTLTWRRTRWRDDDSAKPVPYISASKDAMNAADDYGRLWAAQGSMLEFVDHGWSGHDAMKHRRFAGSRSMEGDLAEEAK